MNRGLTQSIWDKVGGLVSELLFSYAEKFSKSVHNPIDWKQSNSLHEVFEPQEVILIKSLLELVLCSSLCTCVAFPDILPKLDENTTKRNSKSQNKLKSSSSSHVADHKCCHNVESRLKSQSDSGKGFADDEKLWVRDNPHLTSSHGNRQEVAMERSKAELKYKEACTERRLLRKCLYEADVFGCVCPFLFCSEMEFQVRSFLQIYQNCPIRYYIDLYKSLKEITIATEKNYHNMKISTVFDS